jgi:hypothetical protein
MLRILLFSKGVFMDYVVYITDECRKEAKAHNYIAALEKLALDVERKQNVANFNQFPAPFLVKKKIGAFQGRLIAAQKIITIKDTDYAVINFLAVLIKANREYSDFQDNANSNGDKYLRRINDEDLRKYVEEKIAEEPTHKKQSLSPEEESFLFSSNITYSLENEPLIYESADWIKSINSKQYADYLSPIYDAVLGLLDGNNADKHSIATKNFQIVFFNDLENKYLFLIGICSIDENIDEIFEQWKKRKKSTDVERLARRSYPQYLLGDQDLWHKIEKDAQSNFALSGEEINVLKSINEQYPFPLFINGRAGSGKSTILQYIFAEYFFRYLSYQDAVPPPVYFTYNSELLKQAKIFVMGLLKTNSKFAVDARERTSDEDLSIQLEMSFNELRKYLLNIADEENIFFQNKYVNYSTFIKLWNEKFKADKTAQREYPADISWHVIRTYIEGISPEDYLEPEDYVGLEKDQKTVSPELYQKIYKIVWKWYKNLKEEENLWDDQDLVRYIIENDLATPRFSGVFCDESQDFTRIEMEVIYRLSIFSDRDIPVQYVAKIPFVFAGDELQTINPTGFRWDAITALFTEKFILSVYPDKTKLLAKPNFKELKNNYRSTQNIVNFCNALQLFRANRFNIPNLLPQYPWENSVGPGVARFDPKSADFWQAIKAKSDSVVFIVPCNEGEEIEWIRSDSELRANIAIHNETPDILVLSANSAKGLEFGRVVVWKFGGQPGLEKLIDQPQNEDAAQLLPLQYHINKTYVAVSRAKSKLYILDDAIGTENLWRATKDSGLINSYLSEINNTQKKWEHSNLEIYKEGSASDFSDDIVDNQEETAKQLMENGLVSEQSYLLKHAARIFANLNNSQNSAKCAGYAEIFDKNYLLAGECFYNGGWTDLALQSFLLSNALPDDAKGFNKIIELSASNAMLTNSLYYRIALAVCRASPELANELVDFFLSSEPWQFDKYFPFDSMKEIIGGALNKCINNITENSQASRPLLEKIAALYQKKTLVFSPDVVAAMAFSLSNYKLAVDYWDLSANKDKEKYEYAKTQLKSFPDNITLLFYSKRYSEIISEYKKYTGEISSDVSLLIIQALFFENQSHEAFDVIASKIYSAAQFEKIIRSCSPYLDEKEKTVLSVCRRVSSIFNESWSKNLKLIEDAKIGDINPIFVAIALARTEGLPAEGMINQRPFSDFLEKEFIRKFESVPDSLIFDIGTAIEKAGRRIDILEYYGMAMKRFSGNPENERICAERWILTKENQAQHSGSKEKAGRAREAAEKRKAYGIEGKIADFITLEGKSSVIKYIINCELDKKPEAVKPSKVTVKIPRKNHNAIAPHSARQKVEFEFENYRLAYFTKLKKLNIESNTDGKTISLQYFKQKNDCFLTHDYAIKNTVTDKLGNCQKIEETPICFCVTEEKISVYFENTNIVINFL